MIDMTDPEQKLVRLFVASIMAAGRLAAEPEDEHFRNREARTRESIADADKMMAEMEKRR